MVSYKQEAMLIGLAAGSTKKVTGRTWQWNGEYDEQMTEAGGTSWTMAWLWKVTGRTC